MATSMLALRRHQLHQQRHVYGVEGDVSSFIPIRDQMGFEFWMFGFARGS